MAVWSIVVEYIDLYWVVMPTYYKNGPQITGWISRPGRDGEHLRAGFLEPFREEQDGAGGRPALRAEPAF